MRARKHVTASGNVLGEDDAAVEADLQRQALPTIMQNNEEGEDGEGTEGSAEDPTAELNVGKCVKVLRARIESQNVDVGQVFRIESVIGSEYYKLDGTSGGASAWYSGDELELHACPTDMLDCVDISGTYAGRWDTFTLAQTGPCEGSFLGRPGWTYNVSGTRVMKIKQLETRKRILESNEIMPGTSTMNEKIPGILSGNWGNYSITWKGLGRWSGKYAMLWEVPTGYTRYARDCIRGHNMKPDYYDTSISECANLCNANDACKAFEYMVLYGPKPYTAGKCTLQNAAINDASCDGGTWNVDLFVKQEYVTSTSTSESMEYPKCSDGLNTALPCTCKGQDSTTCNASHPQCVLGVCKPCHDEFDRCSDEDQTPNCDTNYPSMMQANWRSHCPMTCGDCR